MRELTPREIVAELDRYIVGQEAAKRAVAVAVRNRWRRQQLGEEMRREIAPRNILMIGPTGVGKTEIARRLARLTGAPFVKVEATKYTEVGYYGRDVESMVRDLIENAIGLVREEERQAVKEEATRRAENRLLALLAPSVVETGEAEGAPRRRRSTREKMRAMLRAGELDDRLVEISVERKAIPLVMTGIGTDHIDLDIQNMFEKFLPKQNVRTEVPVREARKLLFDQECDALINEEQLHQRAIRLAENLGIIFIDEIDKVVASEGGKGPDVSRQGVQRDLLPIVEGTTVQTRYGYVRTDHVLFVAAGAFHKSSPSDLMPELQGRFPIRVELSALTKADFIRILTEPRNALLKQYEALLATENVTLRFTPDAVEALAEYAFQLNQSLQNIGARRLYTIMERLVEDLSFDAPERAGSEAVIDAAYVRQRLEPVVHNQDLSQFIL